MLSRTASCSCGQLQIEVQGEPRGVGVCHCLACQRRTGSVFAALAGFAAPYKVFGIATEYVRVGDQGAKFKFRFCPVCGTTVFHTEEGYEQSSVAVAVGAFADPSFPAPEDSVYDCRRHPWVQLPPGTKAYDEGAPNLVAVTRPECSYPLSPGGRYLIDEAFCSAASVSSTDIRTVVCMELSAPPALIASAVAAIETLSGASHKL